MKTIVMLTACAVMTAVAELVQVGTDQLDGMPMMEEKREKAPDGVNEIITYGDGQQAMTTVCVDPPAAVRQAFVFRGEVRDGRTFIVGVDGEKREVVLISPFEYEILKRKVEDAWKYANSTYQGRVTLHGKEVAHEIDMEAHRKVDIYEDGYRHEEVIPHKTKPSERASDASKVRKMAAVKRPNRASSRHLEMLKRIREAKGRKPKEVTVEHNAITGKDEVK